MKTFLPPMDPAQEKEALLKMQHGSKEAKNELIERNMRLVAHIARKYQSPQEDMEELISIGTIGLIKAVQTFDPKRGIRIGTYAARCIDNELLMYFRTKKKTNREISIYEPIGTDKEGNQIQLLDIIEGEEVDVVDRLEMQKDLAQLHQIFSILLTQREQEILILRYGLGRQREWTQREIAEQIGISRSYVSRIEKRAILKLRHFFEKEE